MNIYLNNDVISDLSLTDSEIGVYVALRNIYLSNRDYQVVTFNMIAYELFGNKDYKRAIFESIKSSFKSLVDKEIITIIDELYSTEFVVNLSKLYINMENNTPLKISFQLRLTQFFYLILKYHHIIHHYLLIKIQFAF